MSCCDGMAVSASLSCHMFVYGLLFMLYIVKLMGLVLNISLLVKLAKNFGASQSDGEVINKTSEFLIYLD